jgi:DNA-binding PadR family transcriptional regulator
MFDLQTLGGMQPSRYAEALKSLKSAGYIAIAGEAPEQMIQLTSSGAEVVRLARPA